MLATENPPVEKIVAKVKAEGVFDKFRRDCVSFIEDSVSTQL
jgi:hypothetical protein